MKNRLSIQPITAHIACTVLFIFFTMMVKAQNTAISAPVSRPIKVKRTEPLERTFTPTANLSNKQPDNKPVSPEILKYAHEQNNAEAAKKEDEIKQEVKKPE